VSGWSSPAARKGKTLEIEKLSGRGWLRVLVAVIGVGALIVIAVRTESDASDERDSSEASAIRLAEIYTEGAFFALTAVGFVLCAYVLTRAGEGDDPGSSPDELAPGEEEEARDDEDEWHEEEGEASTLPDEDAEHEKSV